MKYRQIIFDIDGTLIDTEYAVLHSLQDTIRTITGAVMPIEKLTFVLGITGTDGLKRLEIEDISGAHALWEENMRAYTDTITVFDRIAELLESLSQLGYRMGIVTSKTRAEYEEDFCRFAISRYFDTVVCSDDTTRHKPAPDPLQKYLELSSAKPSEAIYVGDTAYDRQCAESADVDFVMAGWGSAAGSLSSGDLLKRPDDLLPFLQAAEETLKNR